MHTKDLLPYLAPYGIGNVTAFEKIDSSNGDDFRQNIIIDNRYVLRINNRIMTEERLASIDRLCERYRTVGLKTPKLYRNTEGHFLTPHGDKVAYLSDYIHLPLLSECACDPLPVRHEVLRSIGVFARRYTGVDLSPIRSMWSVIDLAPLDTDIDEKQENLNLLVETLHQLHEHTMADRVAAFDQAVRSRIKAVYKALPRCVIQGDLNDTNILVENGHFAGLIDFNMAGTEVNVNHFCAETNLDFPDEDFKQLSAGAFYQSWLSAQEQALQIILAEYPLNEAELQILPDYRSLCLISQYPNAMAYLHYLKHDRQKTIALLECILRRQ